MDMVQLLQNAILPIAIDILITVRTARKVAVNVGPTNDIGCDVLSS